MMVVFAISRCRRWLVLRPGGIEVAKATVAADRGRLALLGGLEFAIPDDVTGAKILHGAPRRVADRASMAGRGADKERRTESGCGE